MIPGKCSAHQPRQNGTARLRRSRCATAEHVLSHAPTGEREYFSSEVPGLCLESEISGQPLNGRVFPCRKHPFHPAIQWLSRDFASMNPSHPQPRHTDHLASQDRKSYRFLKWHDRACRLWWRRKSRSKGGRPPISQEMRALIRRLSRENVLWSAERIHGHLVLLGFDPPCPDTIRKYMVRPEGGTEKSQNWLTFLRNHTHVSWGMDLFTVSTIRFQILYVFVVLNHARRQVIHVAVAAHPTMAWVIQQLREAMPFGIQPTYLFRDNDGIYGDEVTRFLKGTGIEEVRTAFRCPWQNPFVERYGGTLRRELLDPVIVLSEEHLKRLLKEYIEEYYHIARPHHGLDGETPFPTDKPELVTGPSRLVSIPVAGGLHHRYIRVAA